MTTSRPVTLGILEAGANPPEFLDQHGTTANWFENFFARENADLACVGYQVYLGQLPGRIDACDAYLVTGSAASVNDPDQWIIELSDFVREAARERPVIGVCFGHQLLHKVFGGQVAVNEAGWGVGVHDYQVVDGNDPIDSSRTVLSFVACHSEQVVRPAPETTVIAQSAFCPFALTTIGERVLTVQAHPEMTHALARDLYDYRRPRAGDEAVDRALQSLERATDESHFADMVMRFLSERCPSPAELERRAQLIQGDAA